MGRDAHMLSIPELSFQKTQPSSHRAGDQGRGTGWLPCSISECWPREADGEAQMPFRCARTALRLKAVVWRNRMVEPPPSLAHREVGQLSIALPSWSRLGPPHISHHLRPDRSQLPLSQWFSTWAALIPSPYSGQSNWNLWR